MNVTFGIITDGTCNDRIDSIIDSIEEQKITNYEILIVGPAVSYRNNTRILFDVNTERHPERKHLGWITKKKNIIAQEAKYELIVFLHDYIKLLPGWYEGWRKFLDETPQFEIGVNYVYTLEGPRHADWVLSPYDMWELFPMLGARHDIRFDLQLPIDRTDLTKFQYISGGYWVATKKFSRNNPQLERCGWGESEDVMWAQQTRNKTTYKFNKYSEVKLMKPGKWQVQPFSEELLELLTCYNKWLDKNMGKFHDKVNYI